MTEERLIENFKAFLIFPSNFTIGYDALDTDDLIEKHVVAFTISTRYLLQVKGMTSLLDCTLKF